MRYVFTTITVLFVFVMSCALQVQAQVTWPGCDVDFYTMQDNFGRAMITRDQALARQIIRRNDSALVMTCYDQAAIVSGRAGSIFSDVEPGSLPFFDPAVAVGLTYYNPAIGLPQTVQLFRQFGPIISPMMSHLFPDFNDSISYTMGYNTSNFGSMIGSFGVTIPAIANLMNFNYNCSRMHNVWYNRIAGEGLTQGAVYANFNQWLQNAVPGAGGRLNQHLNENAGVLGVAQGDVGNFTPGGYTSFKTVPAFTPQVTIEDVVVQF